MIAFIETIGSSTMAMTRYMRDILAFSWQVFSQMFSIRTYNSAVRSVLINQIYFTSVQILPLFFAVSICFGVIFIGAGGQYLRDIGLFGFFGHMLMGFVVIEFAPFITVLLIALRSGSAINTEIAVGATGGKKPLINSWRSVTYHVPFRSLSTMTASSGWDGL